MITGCQINLQAIGPYTAGQTASNTFTASGCSASTYTISAGSLSGSGLSLNSSTGVLSGTAVAGSYAFTVAYGGATDPLSLTVNSPPSITSTTLPNAPTASPYAQTLATTGGTGIIACSLTSGSLAGSGLTLNSNCTVTGTAATVGTYTFTATPTDAVGVSGSGQSISLQVIASLLTTNGFQDFTLGSVKLEDFSLGARQTLGGTQLLTLVTAEDPNQSNFNIIGGQQGYMIDTGATEDTSGASDCTITSMATGCGLYIQFMPNNGIGTQNDYIFPGGFMQYYLMSGTWNSSLNRFRFRYTCDTQILPANGAINAGYLAGEPTKVALNQSFTSVATSNQQLTVIQRIKGSTIIIAWAVAFIQVTGPWLSLTSIPTIKLVAELRYSCLTIVSGSIQPKALRSIIMTG